MNSSRSVAQLVETVRRHRDAAIDDVLETRRGLRVQLPRRLVAQEVAEVEADRLALQVAARVFPRNLFERQRAGQDLVDHDADGHDVRLAVTQRERVVVRRGRQGVFRIVAIGWIDQDDATRGLDQDVLGLEITVIAEGSLGVQRLQRAHGGEEPVQMNPLEVADLLAQRLTANVFERDDRTVLEVEAALDLDYVRRDDPRQRLGFAANQNVDFVLVEEIDAHAALMEEHSLSRRFVWTDSVDGPLRGDLEQARDVLSAAGRVPELQRDLFPGFPVFGQIHVRKASSAEEARHVVSPDDLSDCDIDHCRFGCRQRADSPPIRGPNPLVDWSFDFDRPRVESGLGDGRSTPSHWPDATTVFSLDGAKPRLVARLLPPENRSSVEVQAVQRPEIAGCALSRGKRTPMNCYTTTIPRTSPVLRPSNVRTLDA